MLNIGIKKQGKGWKHLFLLLQVASMKLTNEGPGFSIKRSCVEMARLVIVLDKRISSLKHEQDILLGRNIKGWVMEVRGAKSFHRWNVLAQLPKNQEHALVLNHHLANSNVS